MPPIEGIGRPAAPRAGARTAGTPTAGKFTLPDAAAAGGAGTTAAATPAAALSSMLALQEFGDQQVGDREARRHGQDLLELLAELQRDLLRGRSDPATLQRLAELTEAMPPTSDRRLAALISAIVVRVQVELARRQT